MVTSYAFQNIKRRLGTMVVIHLLVFPLLQAQIMNEQSIHAASPGARAVAMGDAYSAEISGVATMYWNPGALGFLGRPSVVLDHYAEAHTHLMNDVLATSLWLNSENSIALGGAVSHVGYIFSGGVSSPRAIQSGITLGYARILARGLSLGATATATFIDVQAEQRWTSSWKAGLLYHPSAEISYGVVVSDVLYGAQLQDSSILLKKSLPTRLEMGISVRWPVSRKRYIIALSVANEKLFGEPGLLYKGGVELYPLAFLALRWGYIAGLSVDVARYGGGIRTDAVQLDYAISPSSHDVQFQQLTVSITL